MRSNSLLASTVLLSAVLCGGARAQGVEDDFRYIALGTNFDLNSAELIYAISPRQGTLFAGFDLTSDVSFCAEASGLICYEAPDARFAVPRTFLRGGEEWEFGGSTFVAEEAREYRLLGKPMLLSRIFERRNGDLRTINYYSCELGLVALTEYDDPRRFFLGLYVVETLPGFGAWCDGARGPSGSSPPNGEASDGRASESRVIAVIERPGDQSRQDHRLAEVALLDLVGNLSPETRSALLGIDWRASAFGAIDAQIPDGFCEQIGELETETFEDISRFLLQERVAEKHWVCFAVAEFVELAADASTIDEIRWRRGRVVPIAVAFEDLGELFPSPRDPPCAKEMAGPQFAGISHPPAHGSEWYREITEWSTHCREDGRDVEYRYNPFSGWYSVERTAGESGR